VAHPLTPTRRSPPALARLSAGACLLLTASRDAGLNAPRSVCQAGTAGGFFIAHAGSVFFLPAAQMASDGNTCCGLLRAAV